MDEKYQKFDRFVTYALWFVIALTALLFIFLPNAKAQAALLYTNVAEGTPSQSNHGLEVSIFSYTPTSSVLISSIGVYQVSYGSNAQFWIYNNSTSTGVFDLTETKMMPDGGAEFPGLFDANDVCFPANEEINIAYTSSSNTFTLHSVQETSMARFAIYGEFNCQAPSQTSLQFIAPTSTLIETVPQFSHWKLFADGLERTGKFYPVVEYWIEEGSSTLQFHRDYPVVSGDRSISAFSSSSYINIQVQHNLAGLGTSTARWHAQARLYGENQNFIPLAISEEVIFDFDPDQDPATYPTSTHWTGVRWNDPYIDEPLISVYEMECETPSGITDVGGGIAYGGCRIANALLSPADFAQASLEWAFKKFQKVPPFVWFFSLRGAFVEAQEMAESASVDTTVSLGVPGRDLEIPILTPTLFEDVFGLEAKNKIFDVIEKVLYLGTGAVLIALVMI